MYFYSNEKKYPGFDDYIIVDNEEPTVYLRGASKEYLLNEAYLQWNKFFSSNKYVVPLGKDIAFFQTCTWSKPYDFSYIGKIIRNLTNKFERVHPIIVSSAGIIPYEYQLNKVFCSYDFNEELLGTDKEKENIYKLYQEVTLERIKMYLGSKSYKLVIWYGLPTKQALTSKVKKICEELSIPFINVPSVKVFKSQEAQIPSFSDLGEFYIIDLVLKELEKTFLDVCKDE